MINSVSHLDNFAFADCGACGHSTWLILSKKIVLRQSFFGVAAHKGEDLNLTYACIPSIKSSMWYRMSIRMAEFKILLYAQKKSINAFYKNISLIYSRQRNN
jgi:hypothetical protein